MMWAFISGVSVAVIVGLIFVVGVIIPDKELNANNRGYEKGQWDARERFETEAVKMAVAEWYVNQHGARKWRWIVPTPAAVEKDRNGPTGDFRSPADQ